MQEHRLHVSRRQVKSKSSQSQITAGLRSTFDRLPYGCLLFMYRRDLTDTQTRLCETVNVNGSPGERLPLIVNLVACLT